MTWIQVHNVHKSFHHTRVLGAGSDGINLRISEGETVALIGPSGGGKSTLLRCMNGLVLFDQGEICVGVEKLTASASRTSVDRVRKLVGMVFQEFHLFPHLTAEENVALAPMRVLGVPREDALKQARELLRRVGLQERASHYAKSLSGGQKQRVAIARSLAMKPKCLLCDEATSALDPETKIEVLAVLEELKSEGLTLIMATHEIEFARRCADRIFVLADGLVIEEGSARHVIETPKHPRTQKLLASLKLERTSG